MIAVARILFVLFLVVFLVVNCDLGPPLPYTYTPFNVTLILAKDSHSTRQGRVWVTLKSLSAQFDKEVDLTPNSIPLKAGLSYPFYFNSKTDPKEVSGVSIRWLQDSSLFGRIFTSSNPSIHVDSIEVKLVDSKTKPIFGMKMMPKRFCGPSQPVIVKSNVTYFFGNVC